ncbi:hypothetical protein [Micavibrio aeruginosavorus]|uniref:hypothetical protein n=1 Tax=Micavibrio aeruginosavorus TaxID=349221 RepID=UPI0005A16360|nr:hypothetical protein [Micavibrio aeruginosavorus]
MNLIEQSGFYVESNNADQALFDLFARRSQLLGQTKTNISQYGGHEADRMNEVLFDQVCDVEKEITAYSPQTKIGFKEKANFLLHEIELWHSSGSWEHNVTASLVKDLERALGA